jgi:hypothetical protein
VGIANGDSLTVRQAAAAPAAALEEVPAAVDGAALPALQAAAAANGDGYAMVGSQLLLLVPLMLYCCVSHASVLIPVLSCGMHAYFARLQTWHDCRRG